MKFVENIPSYLADLSSWYASADLPDWLRAGLDAIIVAPADRSMVRRRAGSGAALHSAGNRR